MVDYLFELVLRMKYAHVEMKKRFLDNDFYKQLEICLSLFCQMSTQSKTKIIKLYSIHDYVVRYMWVDKTIHIPNPSNPMAIPFQI